MKKGTGKAALFVVGTVMVVTFLNKKTGGHIPYFNG